MKFLLDANIPYSAKEIFPDKDSVLHVDDIGLAQSTDEEIISWAKKNKAGLVTRDFDFANILNFPPNNYFGILILKIPSFYTATDIKRVLKKFLSRIDKKLIPKSTIIIEEHRDRIKKI